MSTKKKILIIYPVDFKDGLNCGIYDKMIGQGEAFVSLGYEVSYAFLEGRSGVILQNDQKDFFTRSWSSLTAKHTSFFFGLKSYCSSHHFDICYIRHLIHTFSFYSFLKAIKPKTSKVFYEYPTLPYKQEWKKPLQKLLLIEDGFIKKRIGNYIDLVVHYGGYEGAIPSIQITNGIRMKPPLKMRNLDTDNFRMLAVGRWEYWHGLDRLIKGIAQSDQNVELNIIGEGPALKEYQSFVNSLSLNQKINFHKPLYDSELEELISVSHLGIGTLGLHRKGVELDSSLKHRMYCSYGLPFLFAGKDSSFDLKSPFTFNATADDETIDIQKLIKEYRSRHIDNETIRTYAQDHLTWEKRMRKVLSALEKTKLD